MIIVRTAPRTGGVSYLEETLRQVDATGKTERRKIVLSDGRHASIEGWEVIELPAGTGSRRSGWAALKIALDADVEDLILLEDDLKLCTDGARVLYDTRVPEGCFLLTFVTPFPPPGFQPSMPGKPRVLMQHAGWFSGAQALKFPRASLKHACSIDPYSLPIWNDTPHLFDDALTVVAKESSTPLVAMLLPNPVLHVGEFSACNRHGGRSLYQPWVVNS